MKRILIGMIVILASGLWLSPSTAMAQQKFVVKPLAEKKVAELPAGPLFWRIENFRCACASAGRRGPLGVGRRVGRQSLALHARPGGWVIGGRHQGCGSWTDPPGRCNAVSPSDQRGKRSSGQHNARAHASGLRSVLRARRRDKQPYSPWGEACRSGPDRDGSWCRYADASLEQRLDGPALAGDVRGGRRQTVFISGQVPVSQPTSASATGTYSPAVPRLDESDQVCHDVSRRRAGESAGTR